MSLKEGREGELNAPPYLKRLGERIGEGQKRVNICRDITVECILKASRTVNGKVD